MVGAKNSQGSMVLGVSVSDFQEDGLKGREASSLELRKRTHM
jgi:hypothetical protein